MINPFLAVISVWNTLDFYDLHKDTFFPYFFLLFSFVTPYSALLIKSFFTSKISISASSSISSDGLSNIYVLESKIGKLPLILTFLFSYPGYRSLSKTTALSKLNYDPSQRLFIFHEKNAPLHL